MYSSRRGSGCVATMLPGLAWPGLAWPGLARVPVSWISRHDNDLRAVVLHVVLHVRQGLHGLEGTHEGLGLRRGTPVDLLVDKRVIQVKVARGWWWGRRRAGDGGRSHVGMPGPHEDVEENYADEGGEGSLVVHQDHHRYAQHGSQQRDPLVEVPANKRWEGSAALAALVIVCPAVSNLKDGLQPGELVMLAWNTA